MTRRPSRAGRSRDGLFWNPGTNAEVADNPLLRACGWSPCRAAVNEPCRVRLRGRMVAMTGYHDNRTRYATKPVTEEV